MQALTSMEAYVVTPCPGVLVTSEYEISLIKCIDGEYKMIPVETLNLPKNGKITGAIAGDGEKPWLIVTYITDNSKNDKNLGFMRIYDFIDLSTGILSSTVDVYQVPCLPIQVIVVSFQAQNGILLSGTNGTLLLFKVIKDKNFELEHVPEDQSLTYLPELKMHNSENNVLAMQIITLDIQQRILATGTSDGTITITKYNIEENTIAEELYVHLDGPISSIVLQKAENDVHLLVTGSIGFAIEFRNVFANRLKNGKELLTSTTPQDSILCACYADVDLTGFDSILVGSFDQKLHIITHDGDERQTLLVLGKVLAIMYGRYRTRVIEDLIVITDHGVHIYAPRLEHLMTKLETAIETLKINVNDEHSDTLKENEAELDEVESDEEPEFFWMEGDSLAPPCQSDPTVIRNILSLASLNENDMLYDLGCGDGRICIQAVEKYGCKAAGIEIEDSIIARFKAAVDRKGLQDRVRVCHGDLLEYELTDATVIVTYLLPEAMTLIQDKLVLALNNGARIICNTWGLIGVEETKKVQVGQYNNTTLFLYAK